MLDWKIEKDRLAQYAGRLQVRSLNGLAFSCDPKNPDGCFHRYDEGYGLYVEDKGWLSFDDCHNTPSSYTKDEAMEIARCKQLSDLDIFFVRSFNESILSAVYNMLRIGFQQLSSPVEVVPNDYSIREKQPLSVDALELNPCYGTPVVAVCGRIKLPFYELTTESKVRLGLELERTLRQYNYPFERVNLRTCKRAVAAYLRNEGRIDSGFVPAIADGA